MIIPELPIHVALDSRRDLIILSDYEDDTGRFLCAIRNYFSGEIREQSVNINFHPKWKDTVAKRAAKIEPENWTPNLLLPQRKQRA